MELLVTMLMNFLASDGAALGAAIGAGIAAFTGVGRYRYGHRHGQSRRSDGASARSGRQDQNDAPSGARVCGNHRDLRIIDQYTVDFRRRGIDKIIT